MMQYENLSTTSIEREGGGVRIPSLDSILTEISLANPEKIPKNAIILISAELPGSGSTTVANGIAKFLEEKYSSPEMRFVGGKVREQLDVGNDQALTLNLHRVPDPLEFDRPFYRNLPVGKPLIIEGKLAVDAGPNFLNEIGADKTRPIIGIRLKSHPLLSAIRIMRREGLSLPHIINNPLDIPPRAAALSERTRHISELIHTTLDSFDQVVTTDRTIDLDTAFFNQEEILGLLTDNIDWLDHSPGWEEGQLKEAISHLETISRTRGLTPNLKDGAHFRENIDAVAYNLTERLYATLNAPALKDIRGNIRNMLTHATFALLLKKMPRFVRHRLTNAVELDTASQKWTPEYYKMMVGWQTIKSFLKDKSVLDPFAGAGTFVNVLTARGIIRKATFGDISYVGGIPLNDAEDTFYDPDLNTAMMQAVFNGLPSWYKPQCLTRLNGYVTLDAKRLPFSDNSFDWTTGDPPYGINLHEGGIDLFVECLPELLRVSTEGGFFLVPLKWVQELKRLNIPVQQLTDDLASHNSDVATCFIAIPKNSR